MNYELYMAEAIAEARRGAEEGEKPVGSVAVLDDAMIARDHDRSLLDDDPTAHAVMLTIRAAARKLGTRRLSDVTIFTTNEPCPMCVGALLESDVEALANSQHILGAAVLQVPVVAARHGRTPTVGIAQPRPNILSLRND